jgi:branched-chain amino acid transport system ATP-binding protein
MLNVRKITAGYGRVEILKEVTLSLGEDEIVTLIGANGAGKSTLLRVISGLLIPHKGEVDFKGKRIDGKKPDDIVRKGISQVPENRQIFGTLTVRQNLLLGTYARRAEKHELNNRFDLVFQLFEVLERKISHKAANLSGGEQQMLAIGRSLMSSPEVLLLDEPSMGLAPQLVKRIFATIDKLRSEGISMLLVEQNAISALEIADRGYVMETGKIVMQERADSLIGNAEVRKRYLGK